MFAILIFGLVAPWATLESTASLKDPTVQPIGLRIVAERYEDDDTMRAFSWHPGTTVSLMVVFDKAGCIAADVDQSQITSFVDDKKKDLMKKKESTQWFGSIGFQSFPKISADSKAVLVEIYSPHQPTQGSKELSLRGTLVVKRATKQVRHESELVTIEPEAKIQVGPIAFRVEQVGEANSFEPDFTHAVTLEAKQDLSRVAKYTFLTKGGQAIEMNEGFSNSMSFGGDITISKQFEFKAPLKEVKVAIDYWDDMKEVQVPIDTQITLGL